MDTLQKKDFPLFLQQITQIPERIFLRGAPLQYDADYIAIVGTRVPSPYGRRMTYEIAKSLVECGVIVVSGLAFGVDFLAHKAAVDLGKPTVAFLASGVDRVTPSSHAAFAKEIVESGGSILSEYENFDSAHKYRFLERNRLISGLCRATIVVEAKAKSGALITARHAFEQDREVYALVGDVDRAQSRGCLDLIERDMAQPITSLDQLLRDLRLRKNLPQDDLSCAILATLEKKLMGMNDLCAVLKMSSAEVASTLMQLEIAGAIVRHQGKWMKMTTQKLLGRGGLLPDWGDPGLLG
ncbi:MAG TPA: DNA-processing protein DprA [Candidatus Gracilibacteria bacterium]|nr:DNA-processing protein DprA [Candidatus Gracilibacteria bacterium]